MFPQIRTIAHYTLLEALRNRLVWLLLLVALAGVGFSGFLEELALTEKRETQHIAAHKNTHHTHTPPTAFPPRRATCKVLLVEAPHRREGREGMCLVILF